MVGALVVERSRTAGMIHGPVVLDVDDPLEVAAQLLGALLPHASREGMDTLFVRPQGLDRVWVRLGFIPVPEADLPSPFKERPGTGLFAWRGGSALWSSRKSDSVEGDRVR
jgi:N-acetylglutamate synthase-like GNAT family acetyltransferase